VRDNRAVPALDDPQELRRRVTAAPVARLATLRRDGTPRLVPVTFAVVDDLLCFAVDTVKPKRDTRLARLADIDRDPRVALLVDHYADDWSALWWVRADGLARVLEPGEPAARDAVAALCARYAQYAERPPAGPVLAVAVNRWSGWSAASGG
jgi:PPOX class probable F420-dependent enzyme